MCVLIICNRDFKRIMELETIVSEFSHAQDNTKAQQIGSMTIAQKLALSKLETFFPKVDPKKVAAMFESSDRDFDRALKGLKDPFANYYNPKGEELFKEKPTVSPAKKVNQEADPFSTVTTIQFHFFCDFAIALCPFICH